MARGRLIFPMLAEIFRLDTAATKALTPPADTFGGPDGFDPVFRVPVLQEASPSDKIGTVGRVEKAALLLPAQVEEGEFEDQRQHPAGNIPNNRLILVFHRRDFERLGLLDVDGNPLLQVNSRLNRILNIRKPSEVILKPRNPPGLFMTEILPESFGLTSQKLNLYVSTWEDREVGAVV